MSQLRQIAKKNWRGANPNDSGWRLGINVWGDSFQFDGGKSSLVLTGGAVGAGGDFAISTELSRSVANGTGLFDVGNLQDFTVELWVEITGFTLFLELYLSANLPARDYIDFQIYNDSLTATLEVDFGTTTSPDIVKILPNYFQSTGKYHIALVRKVVGIVSTSTLYVNGEPVDSQSNGFVDGVNLSVAELLLVMGSVDDYVLKIGGLRVSNVARYNGSFSPQRLWPIDENTVAQYNFTEGNGLIAADASGNNQDIKFDYPLDNPNINWQTW